MQQQLPLQGFERSESGLETNRTLIVILHGWRGSPETVRDVKDTAKAVYDEATGVDFYVPRLPIAHFLSFEPAAKIIDRLLQAMDRIAPPDDPERYARIVLIGSSAGAVLARRLFLAATDITHDVPDTSIANPRLRHWVHRVERFISLGGLNRGWIISGRLSWAYAFMFNLLGLIGHLLPGEAKPTLFDLRRGAPFIVQTRLQWLALRRSSDSSKPEPLVIQLLGTQDSLVAPDDAVDFAVDRSLVSPYFYLELPGARHLNAVKFDGEDGAERQRRFTLALKYKADSTTDQENHAFERLTIPAEFLADTLPPAPDDSVTHVVFVIHGIRDNGYWTRKIAQKIREKTDRAAVHTVRCITSSYGYFAMLPFLLPWTRRQKVEWLMDEYVNARSRFPQAAFSYVGHSNGTYLAARALLDYPALRFRHVFFAGSVVQRHYDWATFLQAKRVESVVNMVATADWVVALVPQGLEPLRRFFDLGGAGFGGFRQPGQKIDHLSEVRFVKGTHSAALVETQWPRIAEYIVHGTMPTPPDDNYIDRQNSVCKVLSKISPILLLLALLIFMAIPYFIIKSMFVAETSAGTVVVSVLSLMLYFLVLRFIVLRV